MHIVTNLDLLKWDLEGEGLVEVRVERTLSHGSLLLLQTLAIHHQAQLHIGIYSRAVTSGSDQLDFSQRSVW